MKTLNMNAIVKIKLTSLGIKRLKENHEELRKNYPKAIGEFILPEVDEDGYSKMELWKVMKTFGDLLENGSLNMPFNMNIRIDDAEFKKW